MDVAIIGGGAAGFFAAITVKENFPGAIVAIFEKSKHLLAKVKVSGGGRCNVTNACSDIKQLSEAYPRGRTALKRAFHTFNTQHAMQWFESRGVQLMIQDDQRVFPASQSSESIIECFMEQTRKLGVRIETGRGVRDIRPIGEQLELAFSDNAPARAFGKIIVATGGSPQRKGLQWLENLGHKIVDP
ncbi:NAD(P)/FAD-dependent oxidoreductase, partial [bacterium]|nr:NAD(P)/FAD-dependent oxidoreductase [bacterium]